MIADFDTMKKRVGKNLLIYTDTDGWKTDRDVTETDIGQFINDTWRHDLFPLLATAYPDDFRHIGLSDSWVSNGTADAGLTGSTLVATTAIFTNSMTGLYIYNETDAATVQITGYNSSTSVETDSDDLSSWSSDSIYVLGNEFVFGGDATDILTVEHVGVKYTTADSYYKTASLRDKFDFYIEGNEIGSQLIPYSYLTNVIVSGVNKPAIGLIPPMTAKLTNALQVSYIAIPTELSGNSDTIRVPIAALALTFGATARGYEMMQDFDRGRYWEGKYQGETNKILQRYTPTSSSGPVRTRLPRRYTLMARRII